MNRNLQIATLASGCFWCTEAVFKRLKGVVTVLPGYSGGSVENPTSEQVYSGTTGHAEAIQIEFDPTVIPYEKLLDIFWHTHNPTTLNQQGNDIGPEYRSEIFYHDEAQRKIAQQSKIDLEKEGLYKKPVVTTIMKFRNFYVAEDYHKNYLEKHENDSYCSFVITPKIHKLLSEYGNDVKEEYKTTQKV